MLKTTTETAEETISAADGDTAAPAGEIAQTLDRGLRLLELLAHSPDGATLAALAARAALNRTVTYRLLNTLLAHKLVARLDGGRYCLGMGVVELGRNVRARLHAARPELRRLAEDLGQTAHLTLADGAEGVVFLSVEPPDSPMHVVYRAGFRHPLARGASGVAILAGRPPQPGERPEIELARRRGYALTHGEIRRGGTGVAAPIVVGDGPADASVGIVLVGEIEEAVAGPRVAAAARTIAAALR